MSLFSAHFVVGLLIFGCGGIFFLVDRSSRSSRPLALCLVAVGLNLSLSALIGRGLGPVAGEAWSTLLEFVAMVAGVEWGRRIGLTARGRLGRSANGLFRAGQILIVVYAGLTLGYLLLWPELATADASGVVKVRALEFAIFAPVLGTAMLLTTIAIVLLCLMPIDPAEKLRLRSILAAGPFLLAGLVVGHALEPVVLALGLVLFLHGTMRYLVIQGERGQFMRQFLSPEVARMVNAEGLERALQREKRSLSVVACDLRGFTAYAAGLDSRAVVAMLERYYDRVGEVAAAHGGTIKDHAGDGVLILVGAPVAVDDHCARAVALAQDLVARVRPDLEGLGLGVGVASGEVTVGAIQGASRLEYVAVGNAVNLAARLCDRAADGEVLMDEVTATALTSQQREQTRPCEPQALKGFAGTVGVVALAAPP